MNERPDVSVVMSVYNGAAQLRETVDSILGQQGVSLEFIIVNDGSTDESPQICDEYAQRDPRIRIIHQENQGLTKALIAGCAAATGDYIARQDVGDVSSSRRLYLQKAALDSDEQLAFVSCWTEYCGPEWEHLYLSKGSGAATSPINILAEPGNRLILDGPCHHGSVIFRKDYYIRAGGYRAEFYYAQDWDLWCRFAELGKFQALDALLYRVRVMPESISTSNKKAQEKLGALALAALKERRQGNSDKNILQQARGIRPGKKRRGSPSRTKATGFYFIGECLRRNGDSRSTLYFKKATKATPLFIKSWVRLAQSRLMINFKLAGKGLRG